MASTYLTLVNNVLRDMNEVELTSSNFTSSRGVQTTVKITSTELYLIYLTLNLTGPLLEQKGSVDAIAGKQLYSFASIASTLKYIRL